MATGNPSNDDPRKDRYQYNDIGPFKSILHTLVLNGPGKKKTKIDMRDCDIMVAVGLDESTVRLLHLRNVREDTAIEAKAVIKQLLDELKARDDSTGSPLTRSGCIDREHAGDEVHEDIRQFLYAQAEERGLDLDWDESDYSRRMLRSCGDQTFFTCRWPKAGYWETGGNTRVPWFDEGEKLLKESS
ncbi:unnamed protein product [Clonostachys byssicola]|uniref:Uncharacterized protein n=1 Tax=Clonostachys byssicola TaxID=160290 RepID=A0A9N9U6E4_9HYPO|nr:unnamed protein product [Clonostachys byssicola]